MTSLSCTRRGPRDANAAKLTLKERFIYAQAPVDTRTENQLQAFLDWAASHAEIGRAHV